MKSFTGRHLWYLSETLMGLAFFDSQVSDEVRVAMFEVRVAKPWSRAVGLETNLNGKSKLMKAYLRSAIV